jgi:hypothetical protein
MTWAGVRRGNRLYDYNGMEDWSSRGQIRTSWIRADAQVQALRHRSAADQSARELAASAANLEALIAEKKRPGEAKLRALGTQLYVRYYGTEDHDAPTPPQDPLIELKATELRLSSLPPIKMETTANVSLAQIVGSTLRSNHSANHSAKHSPPPPMESETPANVSIAESVLSMLRSNHY